MGAAAASRVPALLDRPWRGACTDAAASSASFAGTGHGPASSSQFSRPLKPCAHHCAASALPPVCSLICCQRQALRHNPLAWRGPGMRPFVHHAPLAAGSILVRVVVVAGRRTW